jgi:hypothetical protein
MSLKARPMAWLWFAQPLVLPLLFGNSNAASKAASGVLGDDDS